MEYKLVRENRKTLVIKILENGDVLIKSPKKCSLDYINKFVISKQSWIEKNRKNTLEQNQINKDYLNLNKLMILGGGYDIIDYTNHYSIGKYYIKHTKNSNKNMVIKKFLISLASEHIVSQCEKLAENLGLNYKSIEIISARKKWGSCDNLKRLKFNFRLIMLPEPLIDYVIYHELCHLVHLNHSKKFWEILKKLGYEKNEINRLFKPYGFVLNIL